MTSKAGLCLLTCQQMQSFFYLLLFLVLLIFYHFRVGAVVEFHGFLLHISNGSISAQRQRDEHDSCTQRKHRVICCIEIKQQKLREAFIHIEQNTKLKQEVVTRRMLTARYKLQGRKSSRLFSVRLLLTKQKTKCSNF